MGRNSNIAWTDSTFSPWGGCEKVSQACARCYAEAWAKRTGFGVWGGASPRRFFPDDEKGNNKHWNEPLNWNRRAAADGRTQRVFCSSMADVFEDRRDLDPWRERLWKLIEATPSLTWLLLTKRPENLQRMLPDAWFDAPRANVWLGTTVEDQENAARLPHLLSVPAIVHFASVEPMLGEIRLDHVELQDGTVRDMLRATPLPRMAGMRQRRLSWVLVGGESGHGARAMDDAWVRSLCDQCTDAGVAFFFKQRVVGGLKVETPELDGRQWIEFPTPEVAV